MQTNIHSAALRNPIAFVPAPVHMPVFAGLGLHNARHGGDPVDRISLSSTVLRSTVKSVKAATTRIRRPPVPH